MTKHELTISREADLGSANKIIEACCTAEGLRVSLKTSLKKFPGSKHWHFKLDDSPGTLEITLWQHRIWCSVRAGRTAPWVKRVLPKVCQSVEARFAIQ
jgi:hypothetical protein